MATIFCFSGTGNSLYAARKIAVEINAEVRNMRSAGQCGDDVIGFVFPTHFSGLPKAVDSFLDNLTITNKNVYIFSVTTYGGFSPGVNGAVGKKLIKHGLTLDYSAKVMMVGNFLPVFNVNDSDRLWKHSDRALDTIAQDLKNRARKKAGAFTVFNKIMQNAYPPNKGNCAEKFVVKGCNSCGLCEKICPNGNITLKNGVLKFGQNCTLCLGCLNLCPADAIDYVKSTHGKKRYKNRRINARELIKFNSK